MLVRSWRNRQNGDTSDDSGSYREALHRWVTSEQSLGLPAIQKTAQVTGLHYRKHRQEKVRRRSDMRIRLIP